MEEEEIHIECDVRVAKVAGAPERHLEERSGEETTVSRSISNFPRYTVIANEILQSKSLHYYSSVIKSLLDDVRS